MKNNFRRMVAAVAVATAMILPAHSVIDVQPVAAATCGEEIFTNTTVDPCVATAQEQVAFWSNYVNTVIVPFVAETGGNPQPWIDFGLYLAQIPQDAAMTTVGPLLAQGMSTLDGAAATGLALALNTANEGVGVASGLVGGVDTSIVAQQLAFWSNYVNTVVVPYVVETAGNPQPWIDFGLFLAQIALDLGTLVAGPQLAEAQNTLNGVIATIGSAPGQLPPVGTESAIQVLAEVIETIAGVGSVNSSEAYGEALRHS